MVIQKISEELRFGTKNGNLISKNKLFAVFKEERGRGGQFIFYKRTSEETFVMQFSILNLDETLCKSMRLFVIML